MRMILSSMESLGLMEYLIDIYEGTFDPDETMDSVYHAGKTHHYYESVLIILGIGINNRIPFEHWLEYLYDIYKEAYGMTDSYVESYLKQLI